MTIVIRDNFRQLLQVNPAGTPVVRTKEKLWCI